MITVDREAAGPGASAGADAVAIPPDYRQVFEAMPASQLILDPNLRIAAASEAYARALGIPRQELAGRSIFDVFPAECDLDGAAAHDELRRSLGRVRQGGTGDRMGVRRLRVRFPGGTELQERLWAVCNAPVPGPGGAPAWILHRIIDVSEFCRDQGMSADVAADASSPARDGPIQFVEQAIAECREAQRVTAKLQRRNEELDEAQRLAHIGSWHWDARTDATTGSDELLRIYGLDPARDRIPEFKQQAGRLYRPEEWRKLDAVIRDALRTGRGYEIELEALRNGVPIWVIARAEVVRNREGAVVGLRGTVQDITERRLAENRLRESKAREHARTQELAALLDAVPAPVFIAHDPECRHITGNQAADELLRIPRGAEASLSAEEAARPRHFRVFQDGRELRPEELPAQRAAQGVAIKNMEERIVFDDGTSCDALAYATPLKDETGVARGSVLVLIDISVLKRAQLALAARQEQLLSFVQHAPVAVAMFDREMRYLAASREWDSAYGRGQSDLEGRSMYTVHPDLPDRWREVHRRGLAGEVQERDEELWEQADGTHVWLRWRVSPWPDATGGVGGIIIVAEDISARKQTEEALRQSEERQRLVLEASKIGTFEIDLIRGAAHWNDVEYRLLGLKPGSVPAGPETFFSHVHPDDAALLRDRWQEATQRGELDVEFRVIRADGAVRWLAGKGRFVFETAATSANGRTHSRFLGINYDITDRKGVEEALAETQQRFAGIVASAMDAIICIDSRLEIILFNAAAERMFQCSAKDAIGGSVDRFIPERFRATHAENIRRFTAMRDGARAMNRPGTLTGLRANGEEFPIEASVSQLVVGHETLSTVILRDISERWALEREIVEIAAREQRRIGRDLHDDVCQWLAGTELLCSALRKRLAASAPEHVVAAERIVESIRQALARARILAHGLEPSVIQSEGLGGALQELATNASEMFHTRCRYIGPGELHAGDEVVALHLYRIAQEAITNAVRHGAAHQVDIVVREGDGHVTMAIRDDGSGIPQPLPATPGMGLRNMRYRAGVIGATLDIQRLPGGGTEVACTFPRNT